MIAAGRGGMKQEQTACAYYLLDRSRMGLLRCGWCDRFDDGGGEKEMYPSQGGKI